MLQCCVSENLAAKVSRPQHDTGYYSTWKEPDEHNITVEIRLCGKLICKDTSY